MRYYYSLLLFEQYIQLNLHNANNIFHNKIVENIFWIPIFFYRHEICFDIPENFCSVNEMSITNQKMCIKLNT